MSAQAVRPDLVDMDSQTQKQPAVVLVATDGDWAGRSLESVLVANGYAVLRSGDGEDALALARRFRPDALILDEHLPGLSGIDICRLLREEAGFDLSTPIVITAPSPSQRAIRQAAYDAGAWDFCTHPLEADTLILKLGTFLRGRAAISQAREQALIDNATGVLSPLGLERWAEQLAARAIRNHEPLACVVLMPLDDAVTGSEAVTSFLQVSREAFRRSDVVGRTSDGRLALLAPDTDSKGVEGMLMRLRAAITAAAGRSNSLSAVPSDFKAGYWAVPDYSSSQVDPAELLRRAAQALDHISAVSPAGSMAINFDQLPVS